MLAGPATAAAAAGTTMRAPMDRLPLEDEDDEEAEVVPLLP